MARLLRKRKLLAAKLRLQLVYAIYTRGMKIVLMLLLLFVVTPVYAQDAAEDELPLEGSGKLGRFTLEEAQGYALRVMSGEVIGTDVEREQGDQVYYEYLIRRPDDSIFEVEIDATSGELYEIEVERLSEKPDIPFETISPMMLENIALSHMKKKTRKILPIKVLKSTMSVYERKLAYAFDLKQSHKSYRIYVDAISGRILSDDRLD